MGRLKDAQITGTRSARVELGDGAWGIRVPRLRLLRQMEFPKKGAPDMWSHTPTQVSMKQEDDDSTRLLLEFKLGRPLLATRPDRLPTWASSEARRSLDDVPSVDAEHGQRGELLLASGPADLSVRFVPIVTGVARRDHE